MMFLSLPCFKLTLPISPGTQVSILGYDNALKLIPGRAAPASPAPELEDAQPVVTSSLPRSVSLARSLSPDSIPAAAQVKPSAPQGKKRKAPNSRKASVTSLRQPPAKKAKKAAPAKAKIMIVDDNEDDMSLDDSGMFVVCLSAHCLMCVVCRR